MLRIVGYEEKIWNEKHKLLKHFQINAFWVISGDQLHCKELLHSPKLTSTCTIPKFFFFLLRDSEGSKNDSKMLKTKLLIVQEKKRSCCNTRVFGFTNLLLKTYYWKEHWFLLSYCVLDCVCVCVTIVKNMFCFFQVHPITMRWPSCTMFIRDEWRHYLVMTRTFCYIVFSFMLHVLAKYYFKFLIILTRRPGKE